MGLTVLTEPDVEPIRLDEAKDHIRVDVNDDDALISSYITTARQHLERTTNRSLVAQTFRYTTNTLAREILLPRAPVLSISSVSLLDTDGNTTVVASGIYALDTTRLPHRLRVKTNEDLPSLDLENSNSVTIDFVAGYTTASGVPEPLRAATKLLVGQFYEQREPTIVGVSVNEVPLTLKALVDPFVVEVEEI